MKKQLIAIALVLCASASLAQDLKPWKIQVPAGTQLKVSIANSSSVTQEAMGQSMEIVNKTEVTELVKASSAAGKTALEKSTASMLMEMSMMGQEMKFNSANADDLNSLMGQQLKPLLERVVTATVDANGKLAVTSAPLEDQNVAAMMNMAGNGNGDSASLAGLFIQPPSAAVKPGASWKETVQGEGLNQETVYTYRLTKDGVAFIDFEATSNMEKVMQMQGVEMQSKTKTVAKGNLQLELATGIVLHREMTNTVEGSNNAMGMEIPMKGNGKTVVKVAR